MTAVVSYGTLRVEFAGSSDFVVESVRGVVCGSVSLAEYVAGAFEQGSSRLLLTACGSEGVSAGASGAEEVFTVGQDGVGSRGRMDGCDRSQRSDGGGSDGVVEESRSVGSGQFCGPAVAGEVAADKVRGKHHRRNKARRERAKASRVAGVTEVRQASETLEWRRKDVRAPLHKGVFADCSEEVQRELRETRAKMLVEKNKVAVVEAEHKRRTLEARLKARMVEEEVERKRLELEAANRKLIEERLAKLPQGFAETVVSMGIESVFDDASVSSGGVSPNSSISVAELKKKNAALVALTTRVAELELELRGKGKQPSADVVEKVESEVSFVDEECFPSRRPVAKVSKPFVPRADALYVPQGLHPAHDPFHEMHKRMADLDTGKFSYARSRRPLTGPGSGKDGYGAWD